MVNSRIITMYLKATFSAVFIVVSLIATLNVWADNSKPFIPHYTSPKISSPLPKPLLEGPGIYDSSVIDYVAEDRLMSGIAPIYAAVHEGDYGIPEAKAGEIPAQMGGAIGGLSSVPPPLLPGLPPYNYEEASPRKILDYGPYTTRLIIYRPKDLSKFSGNVVVEPIHPNGGGSTAMWDYFNEFMASNGDIYIGVQHPRNFAWLKYHKPKRYAQLAYTDYSQLWGMLSDAARVVKVSGLPENFKIKAKRVYLTGFSFTGLIATTYAKQHHDVNRLDSGKPVFDGYPIGTGFGPMPPLDVPVMIGSNQYRSYNDTDDVFPTSSPSKQARIYRTSFDADGEMSRRRRYELPGFEHAPRPDADFTAAQGPKRRAVNACLAQWPTGATKNPNTDSRAFYEGMLRNMYDWVERGISPPRAPLIETANGSLILDEYGNPKGGLRFPEILVPVASYHTGEKRCGLRGWMIPFTAQRLREIYGNWDNYLHKYNKATDDLVRQRYILPWRGERMKLAAARNIPDF